MGPAAERRAGLEALTAEIVACRRCPRLVEWRERVAREKVARFRSETYWGRPVPGFGDPDAGILLVGLAPAAHGGNRTGRVFTGDASGDFLFAAMHAVGLANQPTSRRPTTGCGSSARTWPPRSAARRRRTSRCRRSATTARRSSPASSALLRRCGCSSRSERTAGRRRCGRSSTSPARAPFRGHGRRFGHGAEARVGPYTLVGTYHPSQQNTFTGKLTRPMLEAVLARAIELA